MKITLPQERFEEYVKRLVATHLPDGHVVATWPGRTFGKALERTEYCFSRIRRKYYSHDGGATLDHMNADHMASFIYFLANTIWTETGDSGLAVRLSYLNKVMHGLDLFYTVPMPDIFLLVHPVGTVLGRAAYGDYLVVYQNCTVGAVTDVYPSFGEGSILYSGSSVLGDCHIGDNVVFGANSMIVNVDVPRDSLVLGAYPQHRFAANRTTVRKRCFDAESRSDGEVPE